MFHRLNSEDCLGAVVVFVVAGGRDTMISARAYKIINREKNYLLVGMHVCWYA